MGSCCPGCWPKRYALGMVDLHQVEPGLPDGHPWRSRSRWRMALRAGLGISAAVIAVLGPCLSRYSPFSQSLLVGGFVVVAVAVVSGSLALAESFLRGPCPPDTACSAPLDGAFWLVGFFALPTFLSASIGFGVAIWSPTARVRTWDHCRMTSTWDARIDTFWAEADDTRPEAMLEEMAALVAGRPDGDPDAVYEWASVHDFLGREAEAVTLYTAALESGLGEPRRSQAVVQLASSLRNSGDPAAAVALLSGTETSAVVGSAAQAFLALALHDCGRHDEALRVALRALAPTLPLYGRSLIAYADALLPGAPSPPANSSPLCSRSGHGFPVPSGLCSAKRASR